MGSPANTLESQESVPIMLNGLLNRGIDGAELRFQVKNDSRRKLTFVKYIPATNDLRLRAAFGENATENAVASFRNECRVRGITYREGDAEMAQSNVTFVDCDRDIGLGHLLVRLVFSSVYRVNIEQDCVAYFKNVLVADAPKLTHQPRGER